jgi:hypothetical protein
MTIDVTKILDRIKNLEYHEVTLELYQPIAFNGIVPFDIKIKGDVATFRVLAEDYVQAEQIVYTFLGGLRNE